MRARKVTDELSLIVTDKLITVKNSFLRDPPSVQESLVYSQMSLSGADFHELKLKLII